MSHPTRAALRIAAAVIFFGAVGAASEPALAAFKQQKTKLVGSGGKGSNVNLGWAVALSANGNTAVVGGPGDASGTGATWVFVRSNGGWTQQGGKLVGKSAIGAAEQGLSAAVSADGNTLIIGGPYDHSSVGAAWVFVRSGTKWKQQAKLIGGSAVGAAQEGTSVALSADGNTAIIGGPEDNSSTGAAWIFTRSGTTWTQQGGKVVGTGGAGVSEQGTSVTLSANGNMAMVGGPSDSSGIGAAWFFTRSGGIWTQQGNKLVGTGWSTCFSCTPHQGDSVVLSSDGKTAAMGGHADNHDIGAAWVFTRSGTTWTQQGGKLVGAGYAAPLAWPYVYQGQAVALSGDGNIVLSGGPIDNTYVGATWVFTRSAGKWTQEGKKLVGTGEKGGSASQGQAVALSSDGNTALVGGHNDNANLGAAWVFVAAPAISKLGPNKGAAKGGTKVTITGTHFNGATAVKFGTVAANFKVKNATTISVNAPKHSAGKVSVTVTTSAGISRGSVFTFK